MESSSGSASDTPMPRRTVRRERCFLVMNIDVRLLFHSGDIGCRGLRLFRSSHLERGALYDAEDERGETVVAPGRLALNATHERHISIISYAADAVSQKIFGKSTDKCIGMIRNRLTQAGGAVQLHAVEHFAGGVDGKAAILCAPRAHGVEVLERKPDGVHHAVTGGARRVLAVFVEPLA